MHGHRVCHMVIEYRVVVLYDHASYERLQARRCFWSQVTVVVHTNLYKRLILTLFIVIVNLSFVSTTTSCFLEILRQGQWVIDIRDSYCNCKSRFSRNLFELFKRRKIKTRLGSGEKGEGARELWSAGIYSKDGRSDKSTKSLPAERESNFGRYGSSGWSAWNSRTKVRHCWFDIDCWCLQACWSQSGTSQSVWLE